MKNIILVFFLLAFTSNGISQNYQHLDKIILKDSIDYVENEERVLECSNFILGSSVDVIESSIKHLNALKFIIRWMEGTPNYLFNLDKSMMDATNSNSTLLSVLFAALTKTAIENKDVTKDSKTINYKSIITFINYCENKNNKVKQTKYIKKLIKAKNDNTLKEFIKS
ncbi:MAG: hypothetical protein Q8K70_06570 [Bacteroidota bacterium]|nr:hypothetical protein [Bacteroidota bacterium]